MLGSVNDAMSGQYHKRFTVRIMLATVPMAMVAASASATAGTDKADDPMRFFEGRTEGVSTIKLLARKAYRSRTIGRGEIDDGALHLIQRVNDEDRAPFDRRWNIRQVAPGRFAGTMSEAKGPVHIEEIGGRYRFRFKMKGGVSIEQWLTPLPGGKAASSKLTIRKLGIPVGQSTGTIRKI